MSISISTYLDALLIKLLSLILFSAYLFFSGCNVAQKQTDHQMQATSQEKFDTATLLAPHVISTELPEFAISISSDGSEIYFNRTSTDRSDMRIYQSTRTEQGWDEPQPMSFSNGQYVDVDPFITDRDKRLYFSSNRPTENTSGVFNHWYVERKGKQWSAPILVDHPLNSDSSDIYLTQADNGNSYFRSGRLGGRDLFKSTFRAGKFQEPTPIELTINDSVVFASNPCISSDEKFLLVFSFSPDQPSNADLFVAWRIKDRWSNLQNLGPKVNTPFTEFTPALSKDDQTLFFTSERPGLVPALKDSKGRPPGDIYQISLVNTVPGFVDPALVKEVSFQTSDQVQVFGDLYVVDQAMPIIILFHQGGSNARGEYAPIIRRLTQNNYNVLAVDQRVGGERYGYFNRTASYASQQAYDYCEAYPDLKAALDYTLKSGFKHVFLWGSSYSGSLAIQLAQEKAEAVLGVLAFSPASGGSIEDCQPNVFFETLEKPLLLVRPKKELELESVQKQVQLAQENDHQVYVIEKGLHGSSMLVEERVGRSMEKEWVHVMNFLREVRSSRD